jgi:hypothetical protein
MTNQRTFLDRIYAAYGVPHNNRAPEERPHKKQSDKSTHRAVNAIKETRFKRTAPLNTEKTPPVTTADLVFFVPDVMVRVVSYVPVAGKFAPLVGIPYGIIKAALCSALDFATNKDPTTDPHGLRKHANNGARRAITDTKEIALSGAFTVAGVSLAYLSATHPQRTVSRLRSARRVVGWAIPCCACRC